MNVDVVITNEINRISTFGANLHNSKNSVGAVANHILQKIKDIDLPIQTEELVAKCFLDGWFINLFYYYAIAELVHAGAFEYKGGLVSKGLKFDESLNWSNDQEEIRLEAVANQEKRTQVYQEGIKYIKDNFIPVELHGKLTESLSGCRVNRSNYAKRVVPDAIVLVEFGRRNAYFESVISGKREYSSYSGYVWGEVVETKEGKVVVEIGDKTYEVDFWRVASVKR